jgi:hypothetical protein
MTVTELEKIGTLLIAGATKFLFAPVIAEYMGFNFARSFFWTTTGGGIGILAFTYVGDWLTLGWKKLVAFVKGLFMRRDPQAFLRLKKKKFSSSTRFIIRIKQRFGLIGLALITPCIISIPIGTFVINRFYRKKWKILLSLFLSLLVWSLLLNFASQWLQLSQYFNFVS